MRLIDKSITRNLFESVKENMLENNSSIDYDLLSYMMSEYEYYSQFPEYNDVVEEYSGSLTKEEYNTAIEMVNKMKDIPTYNGALELSANHTLFNINNLNDEYDNYSEDVYATYNQFVEDAVRTFEEDTGVEIYGDGRSGRHIVVSDTIENRVRYDELKEKQAELEEWVVNTTNKYIEALNAGKDTSEAYDYAVGATESLTEATNYLKKHYNKLDKMSDKALYKAWLEVSKAPTEEKKYDKFGACVEVNDAMASDALWEIEGELCRRGYMDEDNNKTDKWKELEKINESLKDTLVYDVAKDLAVEPGSDEEDALNNVYDRVIKGYKCRDCGNIINQITDFDKKAYHDRVEYYCPKCGEPYEPNDLQDIEILDESEEHYIAFSSGELDMNVPFNNDRIKREVIKGKGGRGPAGETDLVKYTGTKEDLEKLMDTDFDGEHKDRIKKLDEAFDPDKTAKRVARYNEFDNGHILHSWLEDKTADEVEELARLASIENPDDVHYVQYDDVMNSSNGITWLNGEKYTDGGFHYVDGKPVHHTDEEYNLVSKGEKTWEDIAKSRMNESAAYEVDMTIEDNLEDEINNLLKSNNADGVQYKVVNKQGVGGGWPTVRFYGDDNKVRDFLGKIGYEDLDTFKKENMNESEELEETQNDGMSLKEYAMKFREGDIDMDVSDTEIDMVVAFVYNFNNTPEDNYDRFLNLLGERAKVVKNNDWCLVCDFSSVFKPYEDKLQDFFNMEYSEFDEAWAEAVLNLEGLIPGMSGEKTYGELIDILEGK